MKTIKEMIANADACRPYYIDTAVYFSEKIAKKKGGTRWAAGVDAMPELPGMTTHPTAGGFFRYAVNEVPTDDVDTFKEPRLAILALHGIPVKPTTKAKPYKPATQPVTMLLTAPPMGGKGTKKTKTNPAQLFLF